MSKERLATTEVREPTRDRMRRWIPASRCLQRLGGRSRKLPGSRAPTGHRIRRNEVSLKPGAGTLIQPGEKIGQGFRREGVFRTIEQYGCCFLALTEGRPRNARPFHNAA